MDGTPKRDDPDEEDFEGAPQESEQQPEEAPPEVTGAGGRDEKRGGAGREARERPDAEDDED